MFLLTSAVGTPKQLAAMGTNFISSFITYTMYNEIIKISPKYVQKLPNKKKTKMECKRKTCSHSTLQKSQSLREDTISATVFFICKLSYYLAYKSRTKAYEKAFLEQTHLG